MLLLFVQNGKGFWIVFIMKTCLYTPQLCKQYTGFIHVFEGSFVIISTNKKAHEGFFQRAPLSNMLWEALSTACSFVNNTTAFGVIMMGGDGTGSQYSKGCQYHGERF